MWQGHLIFTILVYLGNLFQCLFLPGIFALHPAQWWHIGYSTTIQYIKTAITTNIAFSMALSAEAKLTWPECVAFVCLFFNRTACSFFFCQDFCERFAPVAHRKSTLDVKSHQCLCCCQISTAVGGAASSSPLPPSEHGDLWLESTSWHCRFAPHITFSNSLSSLDVKVLKVLLPQSLSRYQKQPIRLRYLWPPNVKVCVPDVPPGFIMPCPCVVTSSMSVSCSGAQLSPSVSDKRREWQLTC